jgi:hypothetical protein
VYTLRARRVLQDRAFNESGCDQLILPEKVKAWACQVAKPHDCSISNVPRPCVEVRGRDRGKFWRMIESVINQFRDRLKERFEWKRVNSPFDFSEIRDESRPLLTALGEDGVSFCFHLSAK